MYFIIAMQFWKDVLWTGCFLAALATIVVLLLMAIKRRRSRTQGESPGIPRVGDAKRRGDSELGAVVVDPELVHLLVESGAPVSSYGSQKQDWVAA
jgi:hypothetical protein